MKTFVNKFLKKGILFATIIVAIILLFSKQKIWIDSDEIVEDSLIESTQLVANAEEDSSIMPMANKPTLGGVSAWSYSYNETSAYKDDNGRNGIIITAMQFRSYHSGANFQIVIPQTIDGKTVVGIESNCNVFGYCTSHYWGSDHHYTYLSIISVTLPSTIKYIGNNAFSNGSYRSYANARFDL